MFPIALDLSQLHIVLVGAGAALYKRLNQLHEHGAKRITVYSDEDIPSSPEEQGWQSGFAVIPRLPESYEIRQASVLMVVGLTDQKSAVLASIARLQGVLVNVEDKPEFCDFYFTSFVARGDLTLAVSTKGASPTLAQEIKAYLSEQFGHEWVGIVEELKSKRLEWKTQGLNGKDIGSKTREFLRSNNLLNFRSPLEGEQTRRALPSRGGYEKSPLPHRQAEAALPQREDNL